MVEYAMNNMNSDILPETREKKKLSPKVHALIGAVLSIFISGLGHINAGAIGRGALLFLGELVLNAGYFTTDVIFSRAGLLGFFILFLGYKTFVVVDSVRINLKRDGNEPGGSKKILIYLLFVGLILGRGAVPMKQIARAQAFKIPSVNMIPTLLVGDMILVDKEAYTESTPDRGDLVVFRYPKNPKITFIKRCVAIAGDDIEIVDKKLLVNGAPAPEYNAVFLDPSIAQDRDNFGPATVPDGEIFVLGDNRDNSNDSRFFGTVKERDVFAKVRVIYWSWDKKEGSVRWERFGQLVE